MPVNNRRNWLVADVPDAEALADKLSAYSWTLCTGFRFGGYLYLNDSFSEDGAGEWSIVRESDMLPVESITFSWCDAAKTADYIRRITAGEFTEVYGEPVLARRIQAPDHSGEAHCSLCA